MSAALKQVAIVGGGIAGLTTAYELQRRAVIERAPLSITVIEADRDWGGKIQTHRLGEYVIEAGPDSFLSQKPWALELCRELGLANELIRTKPADEKAFVFSHGRLRRLPDGLVMIVPTKFGPFFRSRLLSLPGMVRMGCDLFIGQAESSDDESLASFFRRRLGSEAFERLIEPLMAGIYAGDAERMSLRATFPRFLELEQRYGSLIKGVLAARRHGASSGEGLEPGLTAFVTLRGGLGTLIESLVTCLRAAGATLISRQRAVSLRPAGRLASPPYHVALETGQSVVADVVVLATPAFITGPLIRPFSHDGAALLSAIPYASTATISLAYDTDHLGPAVKGFGFVVPRAEHRHVLAATWTSLKWPSRAPEASTLVRCYVGGIDREEIVNTDDETMVQRVRADLRAIAGITRVPIFADVNRWVRGMPQYEVGHLQRLDQVHSLLKPYDGLYLTGAAYRGIGIPDCIRDATRTAEQVLRYVQTRVAR